MTDARIPLCNSPLTEVEQKRLLGLLDELAGFFGAPGDWGAETRLGKFASTSLSLRFVIRNTAPAQCADVEEARIATLVEAVATALGTLASDENIPAHVRLPLLGMLGETTDELAHKLIQQQGRATRELAQTAPGGAA